MNFNAFTIQLTQYISQNHPDKIEDKEFIESRGQQAATVFADCSRQGMNLEECSRQANKVLYAGLHFSPYRMIKENSDGTPYYSKKRFEELQYIAELNIVGKISTMSISGFVNYYSSHSSGFNIGITLGWFMFNERFFE